MTTPIIVILAVLFVIGAFRLIKSKNQGIQTSDSPSVQEESSESPSLTTQLEDQTTYAEVYQTPSVEEQVLVEKKAPAKKAAPKKETSSKKSTAKKPVAKTTKKSTPKKTTAKKPTK